MAETVLLASTFLSGVLLGTVLPGYLYILRSAESRRRSYAKLFDDMLRVASVYDSGELRTARGRLRYLGPALLRSSLASGVDMFMLAAGIFRSVAAGGDRDDEIDPIRWAYMREQAEALLLDPRSDEGDENRG